MRSVKVLTLLAVGFLTVACASTPSEERRDRLGVQAATMLLIERSANPADKAVNIVASVSKVRTLLELTGDVSVADLRTALLQRLAERYESGKVSPLERLAALEAINSVADEVEARLGSGLLTAETRVKVGDVLTWITDAATLYVPHQANP